MDYWPMIRPIGDGKEKNQTKGLDMGKNSVKSTFRNLQVTMKHLNVIFMMTAICLFARCRYGDSLFIHRLVSSRTV